jgi:hypothetical protein
MPMLDLLTTNILHTSLKNVLQTEPAQANPQISNTNLLMQAMLTDPRDAATLFANRSLCWLRLRELKGS